MQHLTDKISFLKGKLFQKSIFLVSLLNIACLMGSPSVYLDDAITERDIQIELAATNELDTRFDLYKELLASQIQAYREHGGDIAHLASVIRIATTDENQRDKLIQSLNGDEREIFTSYDALINLANDLVDIAIMDNITYHIIIEENDKRLATDKLKLYYLQILELEEALDFPVHGPLFWIREQTTSLTGIIILLEHEIRGMYFDGKIKYQSDLSLEHKEIQFYWSEYIKLCDEFLSTIDSKWSDCNYDRMKILNLVFGSFATIHFPHPTKVANPIDQFFPYILKHADLKLAKERFDEINESLSSWDFNFEWVNLHIKAAKFLLSTDREKAITYLEKAKKLADDTLWCYSFSYYRSYWYAQQEKAQQLIKEVETMLSNDVE